MRQNILIFGGLLAILIGFIWFLQGAGILRWPADSFMIASRVWMLRGLALVVVGAILVGGVRLVPTRAEAKARRKAEREMEE